MEPFTTEVDTPIKNGMPALMYGTQLSEEGLKCSIPGRDYNKLYEIWSCPRIVMNVAVSTRMFTSCVPFAYHKVVFWIRNGTVDPLFLPLKQTVHE